MPRAIQPIGVRFDQESRDRLESLLIRMRAALDLPNLSRVDVLSAGLRLLERQYPPTDTERKNKKGH